MLKEKSNTIAPNSPDRQPRKEGGRGIGKICQEAKKKEAQLIASNEKPMGQRSPSSASSPEADVEGKRDPLGMKSS